MRMKIMPVAVSVVLLCASAFVCSAQESDDIVRLSSSNPRGVPVHPAAGDRSYVRWPNGATATVMRQDPGTGWFEVRASGDVGWVTRRYIAAVLYEEDDEPSDLDGNEIRSLVVGTWNIEYLQDRKSRGFPEYTRGGPTYPARTDDDYRRIADIIENRLSASVLLLNEVNGRNDGRSRELDRLTAHLGEEWRYLLGRSGSPLRLAALYNSSEVETNLWHEFVVARRDIQGEDIFPRDPIAVGFRCIQAVGPQNDFIVIGVHLASGQRKNQNHNAAMKALEEEIDAARARGTFPNNERDVLIMGDFNANRYDTSRETFWDEYDADGLAFTTLSPASGEDYGATRLAGVPLRPASKIDYIMGSTTHGGVTNDLVQTMAHVHAELLTGGFDDFREHVSDHLPVTIRLLVKQDDD